MSDFRKHLQATKREYESLRYPGDLGAQILTTRSTSSGRWVVGAIFAAAAALFLVLWLNLPQPGGRGQIARDSTTQPADNAIAVETEEWEYTDEELAEAELETQYVYTDIPVLSFPEIPEEVDFSPAAPSFSVSVPTFSLLSDEAGAPDSNI